MTEETAIQPSEDAGLLDSVSVEAENTESTDIGHMKAEESTEVHERPVYWPENFWDKDKNSPDMEGIAKSWMDLRKMVSQGKHKSPADGKYDSAVFGAIPESDPVRVHVESWAKEYGVSQAAFDALVGKVVEMGSANAEQEVRSITDERRALGQNADAIIKGMVDWANGLVNKGVWGKDDFEEFKFMGGTAKGLKALMKLRESYEGMRIPMNSTPIDGAASKEELYSMVGDPRYQNDPAYRKKVEKMFAQTFQ
jgi:hypothetical protein